MNIRDVENEVWKCYGTLIDHVRQLSVLVWLATPQWPEGRHAGALLCRMNEERGNLELVVRRCRLGCIDAVGLLDDVRAIVARTIDLAARLTEHGIKFERAGESATEIGRKIEQTLDQFWVARGRLMTLRHAETRVHLRRLLAGTVTLEKGDLR